MEINEAKAADDLTDLAAGNAHAFDAAFPTSGALGGPAPEPVPDATSAELDTIKRKLAAIDAAIVALQSETDPIKERMFAVALAISRSPDDESLHADYDRLLKSTRPDVSDRARRLADLNNRAIELEHERVDAEKRARADASIDARTGAVDAAAKLRGFAQKVDKAANALIDAVYALRTAHLPVNERTGEAIAYMLAGSGDDAIRDAHINTAPHTVFKSVYHAQAIDNFVRTLLFAAGDSKHLSDRVESSPWAARADLTMTQAVEESTRRLAELLSIKRVRQ